MELALHYLLDPLKGNLDLTAIMFSPETVPVTFSVGGGAAVMFSGDELDDTRCRRR